MSSTTTVGSLLVFPFSSPLLLVVFLVQVNFLVFCTAAAAVCDLYIVLSLLDGRYCGWMGYLAGLLLTIAPSSFSAA